MPNHSKKYVVKGWPLALTTLTTLTLTACNSSEEPAAAPPPSTHSHPDPEGPSPSPSVSTADGDDVAACTDGNCEITVTKPVTIRLEGPDGSPTTLSVTEVGPNEIEYEVKSGKGQSKGGASGKGQGCLTVLRANGSGNSCGPLRDTRPAAQQDAVLVQATTSADGTATLHVVSP
ncbi:hypothetical protein ABVB69_23420 [Streptomyces sp. NPDC000349]|uniref:hypothetical protein n=1 Tax=unclassified Streptomyces TaxID=2593676 RepID=UPI002788E098|nr:hypothetical protein [Streptomyces sp. DSM 40167]MDQ0406069.1 hypothetical protein [Streptomyces sp. DSM 40167]